MSKLSCTAQPSSIAEMCSTAYVQAASTYMSSYDLTYPFQQQKASHVPGYPQTLTHHLQSPSLPSQSESP